MTRAGRFCFAGMLTLAGLPTAGCGGPRWPHAQDRASQPGAASDRDQPGTATSSPAGDEADSPETPQPSPVEPVDVLAINDDTITVEEVLAPIRAELTAKAGSMPPDAYRRELLDTLGDRIRTMARDLLLYQEASRRLTEQENEYLGKFTDQRIRDIVQKEYNGRQVRWEQAMAEQGLTPQQARERVRRELVVIRHLQQTITPRIQEPTRRELLRYYRRHKDEMSMPERREMFLIEVPKGEHPERARTKADEALAALTGGAEFADVARRYSEGINANTGGTWGMVNPQSIRGRWIKAAQTLAGLPAGGTSGVVEGDSSFFIVRAGRVAPLEEPEFSEVQLQLTQAYRDRQFSLLVDELVVRLQERATIRPKDLNLFLRAALNAALHSTGGQPPERRP